MNKKELRKIIVEKRDNVQDKEIKSKIICDIFMSCEEYKKAKNVMIYNQIRSEVSTAAILDDLLSSGKRVILPKCVDNEIIPVEIFSKNDLEVKTYGISEPKGFAAFSKNEIELVAVPALGYDRLGYRLGYGAGYYDRFLKNFTGKKAGLCYYETLYEKLTTDEFDINVDFIVTEKGTITI